MGSTTVLMVNVNGWDLHNPHPSFAFIISELAYFT